jgi:ribokinase
MSKRILIIGSSIMTLTANLYKIPDEGEHIYDDGGVAYTPDGKGTNAALTVKKLGGEPVLLTKLGRDAHGQRLFAYYKETGLDTSYVNVDNAQSTGFAMKLRVRGEDDRTVTYLNACANVSAQNVLVALASAPDALYLSSEFSFDTVVFATKTASSKDIPIFLDGSNLDKDASLEALPPIEIFSLDVKSTLELTGINPIGADNALRACLVLCRRINAKYVVLRLGERGAFVYDGKYHSVAPAFPAQGPADRSGGDDAFFAALTVSYLENDDIKYSLRLASAIASLTSSRPGAAVSIPEREELMRYVEKYQTL